MSYATITIGNLLEEVNSRYFLPAIQRPYVWSADQIVTLMDSLMKGYPATDASSSPQWQRPVRRPAEGLSFDLRPLGYVRAAAEQRTLISRSTL